MSNSLKRKYVSDIGKFLADFDASHPNKSAAQQEEIAKHARIARLRDNVSPEKAIDSDAEKIWEGF